MDAMRATPPSLRMSAGTRSSAITEHAPASSAILACSAFVTSMITPPFSISARPIFNFICWSYSHMTPPPKNTVRFEIDGGARARLKIGAPALIRFLARSANRRKRAQKTLFLFHLPMRPGPRRPHTSLLAEYRKLAIAGNFAAQGRLPSASQRQGQLVAGVQSDIRRKDKTNLVALLLDLVR